MSQVIVRGLEMVDDGSWRCLTVTSFAQRLHELRTDKGLTQAELADELKLDRSAISHWESGRRSPDTQLLQRLADYFGVSLDYLCARDDTAKEPDDVRVILRASKQLTEEERQSVLDFIEFTRAQRRKRGETGPENASGVDTSGSKDGSRGTP